MNREAKIKKIKVLASDMHTGKEIDAITRNLSDQALNSYYELELARKGHEINTNNNK